MKSLDVVGGPECKATTEVGMKGVSLPPVTSSNLLLDSLREAVRVYDEQARMSGKPAARYFDAVVIAAFKVGRA